MLLELVLSPCGQNRLTSTSCSKCCYRVLAEKCVKLSTVSPHRKAGQSNLVFPGLYHIK